MSLPWWAWAGLCTLTPLVLLNLGVAWLGDTWVFPLSPSFLKDKAHALGTYLRHRPLCLLSGHPPLEELVTAAERRHRLPPGLLQALIQVESEARVHRISPTGAMGPGQLMPGTARMLRVEDPFDPEPAIDGSARYLAEQLARFDSVPLALAAYNAGPGSVNGRVPRNGETEFYVVKVMAAYARTRPPAPVKPAKPAVAARPPAPVSHAPRAAPRPAAKAPPPAKPSRAAAQAPRPRGVAAASAG
ncbi:lytic transglycosylase domain-containing protein [Myxococcaceae bacterium GXIMD 01537]